MSNEEDKAFLADRWLWQFRRTGAGGEHVRPFAEFPTEVQSELRALSALAEGEIPVLACWYDAAGWTLLTTGRVVWSTGGAMASLATSAIEDATISPKDLLAARTKSLVADLAIVSAGGERHRLELERGQPLSGFWNVLKTIAADNQRRR